MGSLSGVTIGTRATIKPLYMMDVNLLLCYVERSSRWSAETASLSLSRAGQPRKPHKITISELIPMILELAGASGSIQYISSPDGPRRRCPAIAVAMEDLGWRPTVPLAHGLQYAIAGSAASFGTRWKWPDGAESERVSQRATMQVAKGQAGPM